ncbi:MAG: hypothetical protein ACR2NO_02510 [Chloroflexota bacterium]
MTPMAPAETVKGLVEQVNDRGVKLGGKWFNFSKYAQITAPTRGQAVLMTVRGDFIAGIAPAAGANGAEDAGTRSKPSGYRGPMTPERERTITRLSLLSSAAAFFAQRPEATDVDVLDAAQRWERWAASLE